MTREQYLIGPKGQRRVNQCPVCGEYASSGPLFGYVHIFCLNCGLSGLLYRKVDDAIQEWNRIVPVDRKQELQ